MALVRPDRYFSRISRIDIERDILARGYKCLFLDIDNTIRSRATHSIPDDVQEWMDACEAAGIKLCLVSNNWHQNVFTLADEVGLPVVAKSCKPIPVAFFRALSKMGVRHGEALVIGDQVTTDVWGAHLAGLPVYLVQPLANVDLSHMKVIRHLEAAIVSGMTLE